MAWQTFPIYFLWSVILCSTYTGKLQAAATVHFLQQKQFVLYCLSLQSVFRKLKRTYYSYTAIYYANDTATPSHTVLEIG